VAVLESLSNALRLSEDERVYFFALVHGRSPPFVAYREVNVRSSTMRMLSAIEVPALVITSWWDVLAWNNEMKIFRDRRILDAATPNLLRTLLLDEHRYRHNLMQYDAIIRNAVSRFRFDYSQSAHDERFKSVIDDLEQLSLRFRSLWRSSEVSRSLDEPVHFSRLDGLSFDVSSYVPEGQSALRVLIYTPYDGYTVRALDRFRRGCIDQSDVDVVSSQAQGVPAR
jgi:hypothetical protein